MGFEFVSYMRMKMHGYLSIVLRGGPFDIQGGGFVFYWESDIFFVFI